MIAANLIESIDANQYPPNTVSTANFHWNNATDARIKQKYMAVFIIAGVRAEDGRDELACTSSVWLQIKKLNQAQAMKCEDFQRIKSQF